MVSGNQLVQNDTLHLLGLLMCCQTSQTQSKQTERFLNFKCKNCSGEFASSRSYDSHLRRRNEVAGEPPAGASDSASLPSFLREDARLRRRRLRRLRARRRDAARLAPPAPKKLLVCSHQSSSSSQNEFGPVEGGFPRLSLLRGSPNVASHAAVSPVLTIGCIMRIEMRGEHLIVMNQANQRLPSLDVQA